MTPAIDSHMGGDATNQSETRVKHLTKQEFARRLRHMLTERKWSQSEFARRAGLTRDAVSTYCRADSFPGEANLAKMAEALGIPMEQLLPNKIETAIDRDVPSMSMKESSTYPGQTWLQINRMVRTRTALKVMTLLNDDDAAVSE